MSRAALYESRRKKGLCIWCDSPLASNSRSLCEKHRAAQNERNKKWRLKLRQEVIKAYGGVCQCCSESRIEFLAIDHIEGGGRKQRESIGGDAHFYSWLRKNNFPPGYRVMCHNCNFAKGKYGYCPHELEHAKTSIQ